MRRSLRCWRVLRRHGLTPRHLAEKILTSRSALEGAQQVTCSSATWPTPPPWRRAAAQTTCCLAQSFLRTGPQPCTAMRAPQPIPRGWLHGAVWRPHCAEARQRASLRLDCNALHAQHAHWGTLGVRLPSHGTEQRAVVVGTLGITCMDYSDWRYYQCGARCTLAPDAFWSHHQRDPAHPLDFPLGQRHTHPPTRSDPPTSPGLW